VVLAGVDERPLDLLAVDLERALRGVLLDDREEVAEQLALGRAEAGRLDRARVDRMVDAVDWQAAAADLALGVRDRSLDAAAVGPRQAGAASVGVVAVSSRNCWPSSYRAVAAR
jgi:hypothetical protein